MLTLTGVEGTKVELGFLGEKTFDVAALDFRDREGQIRADFGCYKDVGSLALMDDGGKVRLSLQADLSGSHVKLKPSHDNCDGQSVLMMRMDPDGWTGVQLIDRDGKHIFDVPPFPPLAR
jgi:hypothetical protein